MGDWIVSGRRGDVLSTSGQRQEEGQKLRQGCYAFTYICSGDILSSIHILNNPIPFVSVIDNYGTTYCFRIPLCCC